MRRSTREIIEQAAAEVRELKAHQVADDHLLASLIRERFVVTLLSGEAFDGLLADRDGRVIVLVDASAVHEGGRFTSVPGSLILERARIAYMQRVAA